MKVFNYTGVQVFGQAFYHGGGTINQTVKLPAGIQPGIFSLQMINDGVKVMSKAIMVLE